MEEKNAEAAFHGNKNTENVNRTHDLPSPIMLSGTTVQTGEGWFLVVVVGVNSCVGKIREKLA